MALVGQALMARKAKKSQTTSETPKDAVASKGNGSPPAKAVGVRVSVEIPDGTPAYYTNYMEVSHTKWDFSLIITRVPAKIDKAKLAEIQASGGVLPLPADVTINFPTTLMAGLIRALNMQKEAYEKETKTELKESSDERTGQKPKRSSRRRSTH